MAVQLNPILLTLNLYLKKVKWWIKSKLATIQFFLALV